MTNKEIIKRFKFDLEMSYFEKSPDGKYLYFLCDDFMLIRNMIRMLKDMKLMTYDSYKLADICNRNKILSVSFSHRYYSVNNASDYFKKTYHDILNVVPEYIREYKIEI